MAGQCRAALLRVSHYGRSRDDLRRNLRACGTIDVSWAPLSDPTNAVGADVAGAVSLYRDHGRMDDCRAGEAALASLRIDADSGWRFTQGFSRKRAIHALGVHGLVCGVGGLVCLSHLSRSTAG